MNLFSISVDIVKPGMTLAETVYNRERIKLLNRGAVLDSSMIERMRSSGVETVWISEDDEISAAAPEKFRISENPQISKAVLRAYNEIIGYLQEIRGKVLTVASFDMYYINKFLEKIVDQVLTNYRPFTEMVRLKKTAPSVLEHMADVCLLTVATGKIMGMSQYDIRVLAAAALLHDIGKFFIPDSVLNKPGELTESDQFLVMKHTTIGHDLLAGIKGVSKPVLTVAAQHHERLDGSGYPYGLSGEPIHKFSRIVGVTDTYAELVSLQRSGAKMASYEVAEIIGAQAGSKIDKEIVEQFMHGIVAYPLQSIVRLNTGEVGRVIYQNREFPTRPVVKVDSMQIDLAKSPTVFVEDFIQLESDGLLRY